MSLSVDEKWKNFLSNNSLISTSKIISESISIEQNNDLNLLKKENEEEKIELDISKINIDINISTKTKTLYINKLINIYEIFWNIPIINYSTLSEGVIKKEIKIANNSKEDTIMFEEKLKKNNPLYYVDYVIKDVDNPNARKIKYKNQHKLTIGISKKDIIKKTTNILNNKIDTNVKGAFRNCLVLIIRLLDGDEYKETHVKIFNTGIIKIPGILNKIFLDKIKEMIYNIINTFEKDDIIISDKKLISNGKNITEEEEEYYKNDNDLEKNVLINSNFKCGFNIYLDKFYKILRSSKYNIEVSMDTTTYPALRCKYYFHTEIGYDYDKQTGVIKSEDFSMKWKDLNKSGKYKKISIMIFRTGNGLIMGKISEKLLMFIFEKIKNIIIEEYSIIYNPLPFIDKHNKKKKEKKIKIRLNNIINI